MYKKFYSKLRAIYFFVVLTDSNGIIHPKQISNIFRDILEWVVSVCLVLW